MATSLSEATVLIVEDEEFSRHHIGKMLENLSITNVLSAENGAQALELLGAHKGYVSLVICDIMMPVMDGYEFIRRLRFGAVPRFAKLPVIVLTGEDTEENVNRARMLKISNFFVKPPSKVVFEKAIRRIISGED